MKIGNSNETEETLCTFLIFKFFVRLLFTSYTYIADKEFVIFEQVLSLNVLRTVCA